MTPHETKPVRRLLTTKSGKQIAVSGPSMVRASVFIPGDPIATDQHLDCTDAQFEQIRAAAVTNRVTPAMIQALVISNKNPMTSTPHQTKPNGGVA